MNQPAPTVHIPCTVDGQPSPDTRVVLIFASATCSVCQTPNVPCVVMRHSNVHDAAAHVCTECIHRLGMAVVGRRR